MELLPIWAEFAADLELPAIVCNQICILEQEIGKRWNLEFEC